MSELDSELGRVIASLESQLHTSGIRQIANGLEFFILLGELPSGPIAIKVPRDRIFSNVNDAYIDSRVLLDQEFTIMKYLKKQGITQIPEPIGDIEAAGFGALVMSYVPSDDSKPDEFEQGQLLAKIHSLAAPVIELSAQEGCSIPDLIDRRLHRRWLELGNLVPNLSELPKPGVIAKALHTIGDVTRLLHMDYRQANLRTKNGKILAVVDWSNALLGHPALELARIAEIGETGAEFLKGYASISSLPKVSPFINTLLRLDTATMLALVFLSEEPNMKKASRAVARVYDLQSELDKELAWR